MSGDSAPAPPPPEAIAANLVAALDARRQMAPLTETWPGFDLAAAYRVTAAVRALRQARGERPVGRKIGFTNRTIWEEYGVFAPIWGDMYNSTVRDLGAGKAVELAPLMEPRIEPEIVFGLARAPEPGMDEAALFACLDWIAHGVEIVQSLFPGWRFAAADTVAAFGLHGAYRIGPRRALTGESAAEWLAALTTFEIALARDGAVVDRGEAEYVLGGPLTALRHLVALLASDSDNPPLAAGEIVTTGTLTRAWPVAAGERWRTAIDGLPLDGLAIRFA